MTMQYERPGDTLHLRLRVIEQYSNYYIVHTKSASAALPNWLDLRLAYVRAE